MWMWIKGHYKSLVVGILFMVLVSSVDILAIQFIASANKAECERINARFQPLHDLVELSITNINANPIPPNLTPDQIKQRLGALKEFQDFADKLQPAKC